MTEEYKPAMVGVNVPELPTDVLGKRIGTTEKQRKEIEEANERNGTLKIDKNRPIRN
jgi:hypothetical protein